MNSYEKRTSGLGGFDDANMILNLLERRTIALKKLFEKLEIKKRLFVFFPLENVTRTL